MTEAKASGCLPWEEQKKPDSGSFTWKVFLSTDRHALVPQGSAQLTLQSFAKTALSLPQPLIILA